VQSHRVTEAWNRLVRTDVDIPGSCDAGLADWCCMHGGEVSKTRKSITHPRQQFSDRISSLAASLTTLLTAILLLAALALLDEPHQRAPSSFASSTTTPLPCDTALCPAVFPGRVSFQQCERRDLLTNAPPSSTAPSRTHRATLEPPTTSRTRARPQPWRTS
jgi:hypothetical protein